MAAISSPGIGSGLDISTIISQLMLVEKQPLTEITKKEASYQAKLSAFGSMQGSLAALQTASQTLKTTSLYNGKSAISGDSSVLSSSAVLTATAGTYDIAITTIAKNHSVRSNTNYSTSDTFNGGNLSITIGSVGGSGGVTKSVAIPDGSDILAIKDAINGTSEVGVRASVVNDGSTERLILTSNTTGSAGNITIAVAESGSLGTQSLTGLAYDGSDGTMRQLKAPDDAIFSVNGLSITRSSNVVSDVINGVTLNLAKEGAATTVTVSRNTEAPVAAATTFVKAYNDAITQLKNLTAYDATNKKASILTGDSTARTIRGDLAAMVGTTVSGISGGISRLSDLGITLQRDGTLSLDSATLTAALTDSGKDVSSFFSQTTSGNEGIAVRFNRLLTSFIGSDSLIANRTEGLNSSIRSLQKQTDSLNSRLAQIEQRYRKQFSTLDTLVASMQKTSQYLTQQLANLPSASAT